MGDPETHSLTQTHIHTHTIRHPNIQDYGHVMSMGQTDAREVANWRSNELTKPSHAWAPLDWQLLLGGASRETRHRVFERTTGFWGLVAEAQSKSAKVQKIQKK